jgi:hypothetical protein
LYPAAFVFSCAGGGLILWILQLFLGSTLLSDDAALVGGYLVASVGLLIAMIYGIRRWKANAQAKHFARGLVHRPAPVPLVSETTKLFAAAVALALFGALLLYDFNEWEREGGSRRMNVILYGLYSVLGKWGVASLAWAGATVCVKAALERIRRAR